MARCLTQRDELDIRPLDALTEISDFGQRQNCVPVSLRWHVIDEVDNAILEPASGKAIHHMKHQGTAI